MRILKFLSIIVSLIFIAYGGFWLYMGQQLKKEVHQFYNVDGPLLGYEFYGEEPHLSGFPFKPVLTYDKGISHGELSLKFDTLKITAYPFPEQPLDITADKLAFQETLTSQLYEVDKLTTRIIIPKSFPRNSNRQEISQWQKDIGKIDIQSLEIDKNSMMIFAKGAIGLDDNLQPGLDLNTKIIDYNKLIHFLSVETSELKPMQASLIQSVMDSISKTDEQTGQKYVEVPIKIRDRRLLIGPIKTMKFPFVTWPDK